MNLIQATKDNTDRTPLHWAASTNNEAIGLALIKAGANINVCNVEGGNSSNVSHL
jgi:ankyrin repeat protein